MISCEVALDGALGDVNRGGHPAAGEAAGGQQKHLQLPSRHLASICHTYSVINVFQAYDIVLVELSQGDL